MNSPETYLIRPGKGPQLENGDIVFPTPMGVWDHIDTAMVRERYCWVNDFDIPEGRKIQLGAGYKHLAHWENLEYPDWNADFPIPEEGKTNRNAYRRVVDHPDYGPTENLYHVSMAEANSVAAIASYHTLDHLTPEQVVNTLKEIQRVLMPGGVFTNIVPHYMSQLANECIMHKSRFGIDTFRNIFSERQYKNTVEGQDHEWKLQVMANFIYGITERNLVLVTQMMKVV